MTIEPILKMYKAIEEKYSNNSNYLGKMKDEHNVGKMVLNCLISDSIDDKFKDNEALGSGKIHIVKSTISDDSVMISPYFQNIFDDPKQLVESGVIGLKELKEIGSFDAYKIYSGIPVIRGVKE